MRCCSSPSAAKDRCVFTSVLLLGALFAMQAAPCTRTPLMPVLILLGIPVLTFGVAAPSRIGLGKELGLFLRGLEALLLGGLLVAIGRGRDAKVVRMRHRSRVERAYLASDERFYEVVSEDPLRLHHARRLAFAVTTAIVAAGMGLPLLEPSTYTFGDWPEAPFVILLDLFTLTLVGRVVTERVALRLLEITHGVVAQDPFGSRLRMLPVSSLLGVALGAVGSLVIVGAAAAACAVESSWVVGGMAVPEAAHWFLLNTVPDALFFGIPVGAVMGAGFGLAQMPSRPAADERVEM